MRRSLPFVLAASAIATSAPAAFISPVGSTAQLIGSVVQGTTYNVVAGGTVYLCGACNGGGPLSFNPDGTVATTAQPPYAAFSSGPKDYDPSVGTTAYGFYGQGINLGELYGTFSATPTASDLFVIGYGTTFTAGATGNLYGVINDTNYGDNPGTAQFSVRLSPTVAGQVPEPAAWTMMIGGFGMIGAALRRRRIAVTFG